MDVNIANRGLACSTLMLGSFGCESAEKVDAKTFWERFAKRAKEMEEVGGLDGYRIGDFAFVTASTSQSQRNIELALEDFGFFQTRRVAKRKNPTMDCKFWILEMPAFIEAFESKGYGKIRNVDSQPKMAHYKLDDPKDPKYTVTQL